MYIYIYIHKYIDIRYIKDVFLGIQKPAPRRWVRHWVFKVRERRISLVRICRVRTVKSLDGDELSVAADVYVFMAGYSVLRISDWLY